MSHDNPPALSTWETGPGSRSVGYKSHGSGLSVLESSCVCYHASETLLAQDFLRALSLGLLVTGSVSVPLSSKWQAWTREAHLHALAQHPHKPKGLFAPFAVP